MTTKNWLLCFVSILILSSPVRAQLAINLLTTVNPGSPALNECQFAMYDEETAYNYPQVGLSCTVYVNGQSIGSYPASGYPTATWSGTTPWVYPATYAVGIDSYLYMYSNAEYIDVMGYSGSFFCNAGGFLAFCPNGVPYNPQFSPIIFEHVQASPTSAPDVPIISPSQATLTPGQSIQFSALAANSSGQATGTPAPVTWSIQSGNAGGTISSSGLYTASSLVQSTVTHDVILATGTTIPVRAATAVVTVSPPQAPAPSIIMGGDGSSNACQNGNPVNGQSILAVAGVPLQFVGCIPTGTTMTITGASWSPDVPTANSAISQYSVTLAADQVHFTENIVNPVPTACTTAQSCVFNKFYPTKAGTYVFTFTYTAAGMLPGSASVSIGVSAPKPDATNKFLDLAFGQPGIYDKNIFQNGVYHNIAGPGVLAAGDGNSGLGAQVVAIRATAPNNSGRWIFVQTLGQFTTTFNGSPTHQPFAFTANSLDLDYPYLTYAPNDPNNVGLLFNDTPVQPLVNTKGKTVFSAVGEIAVSFQATTYLLWDPMVRDPADLSGAACLPAQSTVNSDGTIFYLPSNCISVPVPVASFTWGWSGDTIQTLNALSGSTVGTWILQCPTTQIIQNPSVVPSQGNSGYPPPWGDTANPLVNPWN